MWNQALLSAVMNNDEATAKALVDSGVDAHQVNPSQNNKTLLIHALVENQFQAALGILSSDQFKFTANAARLFRWTVNQATESCPQLIPLILSKRENSSVSLEDFTNESNKDSCLSHAVYNGCSPEIIKLMIDLGANPNRVGPNGLSPLQRAVRINDLPNVLAMINSETFVYNSETEQALHYAEQGQLSHTGRYFNFEIIHALHRLKIKNQAPSPLRLAVKVGNLNKVRELLENGADVNEVKEYETFPTPLFLAVSQGRFDMIDLLLAYKANAQYADMIPYKNKERFLSPLGLAVLENQEAIIKKIIQDQNFQFQPSSVQAIVDALDADHPHLLEILLEKYPKNISLDSYRAYFGSDKHFISALGLAVEKGLEKEVILLLQHGADPLYNFYGAFSSPFERAIHRHAEKNDTVSKNILQTFMLKVPFKLDLILDYLENGKDQFLTLIHELELLPNKPLPDQPNFTPLLLAIIQKKPNAALLMVKSDKFIYTKSEGGAALVAAKAAKMPELITFLESKKRILEDNELWDDDEPAVTGKPLTHAAPVVGKQDINDGAVEMQPIRHQTSQSFTS